MSDTITNPENVTTSARRGDAITAGASPRPWHIPEVGLVPTEIWSADGTIVARGISGPNAVRIVNAVNHYDEVAMQNTDSNGGRQYASLAQARRAEWYRRELVKEARELRGERDRLRDLVRRLAKRLSSRTLAVVCTPGTRGDETAPDYDLIDEARAAIGEGKQ